MNKIGKNSIKWLNIGKSDLESSIILYNQKFYPQSLYLFHQSLEKLIKCLGISLDWFKSGKEVGHNLTFAVSKVWEKRIDNLIDQAIEDLNKTERLYLEKDYRKFKTFFKKEELKKLKEYTFHKIVFNDIGGRCNSEIVKERLSSLDKENEEISKLKKNTKKYMKKHIPEFEIELKKAKKEGSTNSTHLKKKFAKILEKDYHYESTKIMYAIFVVVGLACLLPKQNKLRYPEYNPTETYTHNHPLIKNFNNMYKHLQNSYDIFTELYSRDLKFRK